MKIIQLAIKTLLRFRLYSVVNILGLALSLACFILISRYVHREVTTDHYIRDLDRVCFSITEDEETRSLRLAGGDLSSSSSMLSDKDVETVSIFYTYNNSQITVDNKAFSVTSFATDSNYLKIITLPIVKSNGFTLLQKPNEAVISKELAVRVFGDKDPIGETIRSSKGEMLTITGIFEKPETKMSFSVDMLETSSAADSKVMVHCSVAKLRKGAKVVAINERHDKFVKMGEEYRARYQLYPVGRFYFDKQITSYLASRVTGNTTHLFLLSGMALLILLIGLFNFINIYTVLMLKRGREFGMKKVFGANTLQVAWQLYAENFCLTGMALFISWILVEIGTGIFNTFLLLPVTGSPLFDTTLSIVILFLLPFIASVYPFIRYNYSSPITSIKSVSQAGRSIVSRNIFLCCQYIITIVLIISSLFFIRQLNYMLDKDLGYNTENIVKLAPIASPSHSRPELWVEHRQKQSRLLQVLGESPFIRNYTFGSGPASFSDNKSKAYIPGQAKKEVAEEITTGKLFDILGFRIKEGRSWNDESDSMEDFTVIINESARKLFEIDDISNAIIRTESFYVYSTLFEEDAKPEYRVIGVIEDFHTGHLSKAVPPMMFYYMERSMAAGLLVEIAPGRKQEAIAYLQKAYEEISGDEFRYIFLEDEVRALYDSDRQLTNILTFFAFIAILISSMGLFSLSLFDIQERYHEIAIRKVNGATPQVILRLLLRKYYVLLGIAFLIAVPVSWLAITKYLEDFAYKASIAWWLFAIAFIVTAAISLITLVYQVTKAAATNPADVIRSE